MANVISTNPFVLDTHGSTVFTGRIWVTSIVLTATVSDNLIQLRLGDNTIFIFLGLLANQTKVLHVDSILEGFSVNDANDDTTKVYIYHK